MNDRVLARLVVSLAFLFAALAVIEIVVSWRNGSLADTVGFLPPFVGFAVVGSVLASRRPRNPIGWLFVWAALSGVASQLSEGLAIYGVITVPGSIPFAAFIGDWFGLWFGQGFLMALVFSVFLIPSGRLPSRRWRPVAGGVMLILLLVTAIYGLGSAGPARYPQIANPFFVPALQPLARFVSESFFLYALLLTLAVASLVARYRSGPVIEKQQLKVIVLGAALMVAFLWASGVSSPLGWLAGFLGFLVLPTAVAVAILRYGLYDIDHLINRALTYGGTSGLIAILFFAGIVALQPLLRPLTSGSELAVAVSTLVAFALFQPIRRRVQDTIDRRFNRSHYDAARTLDAFTEDLRDEVDLDDLQADLISAVRQTMAPAYASLWLRKRGQ